MAGPRVLFLHGLESGPQGTKARLLAQHFGALTPQMDTRDFETCLAAQAETLRREAPDVLVGSSFGGALALALLQRGSWSGPTLLLAPALRACGLSPTLPEGVRVWIVHGRRDELVPLEDSRALAASGTHGLVRLVEVDDGHRLQELAASGRLVALVRELHAAEPARAGGPGRWLATFVEDPALWPVLAVVVAHVALGGALVMLAASRQRHAGAFAALAVLVVMSFDVVRRARRRARAAVWVLGLWLLSALTAAASARLGVL